MTFQNSQICSSCHIEYISPSDTIFHKTLSDMDRALCQKCTQRQRIEYIEQVLRQEKGELSLLEQEILKGLSDQETISKNLNMESDEETTFGERTADKVATFGGSWKFIIIFFIIIFTWITFNVLLFTSAFDPYPFILLNLVLSCLASLQAPVIMMSQNRQEAKDRLRAEHDFRVNLKAELEIRNLNEKIDYLITKQWPRLLEIQKIQMDLMTEFIEKKAL